VTGGAGLLGSLACRMLLEQGTKVVCVDNLLTGNGGSLPGSSLPGGTAFAGTGPSDSNGTITAA
jgi:UDP-glucose 4-epimerase